MKKKLNQDWRTLFLGREKELKWLEEAWELTIQGKPQMRVIISESGYGKTKLAQAFYTQLSTNHDPDGYWPDNLLHQTKDLQVMPDISGIKPGLTIPWIWWGVRWVNPYQRNLPTSNYAFLTTFSDPAFKWHQETLLAAVHAKDAAMKTLISIGELGLAFTGAGIIVDVASAIKDIHNSYCEYTNHKKISESIQGSDYEAIQTVLNTFSILLDPKRGNKGSLPVVLLLDDAQWMDLQSLRIVRELWAAACKGGWPLMVIATHWQREWQTATNEENPATFAGWIAALRSFGCESIDNCTLGGLPESPKILLSAFPGLTQEQVEFFKNASSDNPRHIAELIFLLESKPEWFENSDFSCPLNHRWNENLRGETLDLVSLERKRFDAVAQVLKELLGTASLQGDRFLRAFTLDVAGKLGFAQEKSDDPLLPADNPYALAEALDDSSMEFRSITIRESASVYLRNVKADDEVAAAIAACTREWITTGRLSGLSIHQQLTLLNRSFESAKSGRDRSSQTLFAAAALQQISKCGFHFYAPTWISFWEELKPEAQELADCDFWLLRDTAFTFLKAGKAELARSLSGKMVNHPSLEKDHEEQESFLRRSGAYELLQGELDRESGQFASALKHFRRSLEIREHTLEKFGETAESLCEISHSLERVGNVERSLGHDKSALSHFIRFLEVSEQIVGKFGETPESLRDISLSLVRVGDMERSMGQTQSALARYLRSLKIREQILEKFGETPESLRSTSQSLERVGSIELSLGYAESAMSRFIRVLEINEQILEKFGQTPERLRDISVARLHIGKIENKQGMHKEALDRYHRVVAASEQILELYGETPERLRDLSISLGRVADIELWLDQTHTALERLLRSLDINERILTQFDETPEGLRDLSITLGSVGDIEHSLGQTESALARCLRSLAIDEQIISQFGTTPERLRDLSISLGRVGDIEHSLGQTKTALTRFRRALDIDEQILAEFGETPQSLGDLSISLERIGNAEESLGLAESASTYFRRAQDIDEQILSKYGEPSA